MRSILKDHFSVEDIQAVFSTYRHAVHNFEIQLFRKISGIKGGRKIGIEDWTGSSDLVIELCSLGKGNCRHGSERKEVFSPKVE